MARIRISSHAGEFTQRFEFTSVGVIVIALTVGTLAAPMSLGLALVGPAVLLGWTQLPGL